MKLLSQAQRFLVNTLFGMLKGLTETGNLGKKLRKLFIRGLRQIGFHFHSDGFEGLQRHSNARTTTTDTFSTFLMTRHNDA